MAHKTLIGGTAYTIKGGKDLIAGTSYAKKQGKALVAGTKRSIKFSEPVTVTLSGLSYKAAGVTYNGTNYYAGQKNTDTTPKTFTANAGDTIRVFARYYGGEETAIYLNNSKVASKSGGNSAYGDLTYDFTLTQDTAVRFEYTTSEGKGYYRVYITG